MLLQLYPGFPLARTASVDQKLADQVAAVLRSLQPDHRAVQEAGIAGWIDPLDYTEIKMVQEQLRGGGYAGGRIW
ncbi:MAG: hypothetical protein ACL93V_15100 [Candidatus Electrothrix sp. YB6]